MSESGWTASVRPGGCEPQGPSCVGPELGEIKGNEAGEADPDVARLESLNSVSCMKGKL